MNIQASTFNESLTSHALQWVLISATFKELYTMYMYLYQFFVINLMTDSESLTGNIPVCMLVLAGSTSVAVVEHRTQ